MVVGKREALKTDICCCQHSKVVDFSLISCVCQVEYHLRKAKVNCAESSASLAACH